MNERACRLVFALKNPGHAYSVTKHKFMCPMHSEAKQTEMSDLGAEKSIL